MKRRQILSSVVGWFFLMHYSCAPNDDRQLSEGIIEYDAIVVDPNNPMAALAPTKMTFEFKDHKVCAEMNAGLGMFSTSFISDSETKSMTQLLKLFSNKSYVKLDSNQVKEEVDGLIEKIVQKPEKKMIAGYECHRAHVIMKGGEEFDVYYCKDLKIKDPNFCTPFYHIQGVLMEYQIEKFNMEMKFIARRVKKVEVDDSHFQVPADYKQISQDEMAEIFNSLQ